MLIVADENIPFADDFFATLAAPDQPVRVPGRNLLDHLDAVTLAQVEVLVIRSVTRIDEALLAACPLLRFVGTCTIGTDHIDLQACEQRGIQVVSAPGCNANSVVEYVFAAFAALALHWQDKRVGIIGCGNVGGALFSRLQALDVACTVYDPPLQRSPQRRATLPGIDDALTPTLADVMRCDIVCVHAPLTTAGLDSTYHLVDEQALSLLPANAVLVSAGRGAVVDNTALFSFLQQRNDVRVVLDVWEPEPDISVDLLQQVHVATPHIAGYSFDGKAKGTEMIYQALCHFLQKPVSTLLENLLPAYAGEPLQLAQHSATDISQVSQQLVRQAYDIRADDRRTRDAIRADLDCAQRAAAFDRLRKEYPQRREFYCFTLDKATVSTLADDDKALLAKLGFRLPGEPE